MSRKKPKPGSPRENTQFHLIADLYGCPPQLLRDEDAIAAAMQDAARRGGATIIDATFHKFRGGGVTGVVAIKESHLTIHTWPETGYAAIDVFMCGRCSPDAALAHLAKRLHPRRTNVQQHERGIRAAEDGASPAAAQPARKGRMGLLYALTLTVAACSIIYELLLAQTLAALLGDTVLRYSMTIGCYLGALGLGAMLCSHNPVNADRRLAYTELGLAAIGGAAVPLFYFLDVLQRFFYVQGDTVIAGTLWPLVGFLIFTHAVIVAIGVLSGFEVPLLLAMGRERRANATNVLLGVDYLGALVGSVLFPIVLLRSFGLIATGFMVAALNALAALLIVALRNDRRSPVLMTAGAGLIASFALALSYSSSIEQYFLKKFYFWEDIDSLAMAVNPPTNRPDVERHRSIYQTIDLVQSESPEQWIYNLVSDKAEVDPVAPLDYNLYLNNDYQFYAGIEEIYHEWFVHAPIQAVGRPPRNALVLGGGDGLVVRELLEYASLQRIVHVEIDPEMIRLAEHHPVLSHLNQASHDDPRVEMVQGDALRWLRLTNETFDAIYIDMPYPRDYNLAQVYSREFYSMARHTLNPDGFLMIDAPDGTCTLEDGLWPVYDNTLRAAGFPTVLPVISRINLAAERIAGRLDRLAYSANLWRQTATGRVPLEPPEVRTLLSERLAAVFAFSLQEFVLAFPRERPINTTWVDMGVDMNAFGPAHLAGAFQRDCPQVIDARKVNSIFRPTLPPLRLVNILVP